MAVYDDQKTDEEVSPGRLEELERSFAAPSATESGSDIAQRNQEVKGLEDAFAAPSASAGQKAQTTDTNDDKKIGLGQPENDPKDEKNKLGLGYTGKKLLSAKKGISSGAKKWLIASGAGAFVLVVALFVIILIFASTLKIPHLMENITAYEFVGVTRSISRASTQITNEALAEQAVQANRGLSAQLQERYGNLRDNTIGRLDKYRPNIVLRNLHSQNGLVADYGTSSLTGKTYLRSLSIDGKTYTMERAQGASRWVPGLRQYVQVKNEVAFLKEALPAIQAPMMEKGIPMFVRGQAVKNLLQSARISRTGWILSKFIDKSGKPLSANAAVAEQVNQLVARQEEAKSVAAKPKANTGTLEEAKNAAEEAEKETLASEEKTVAATKNRGVALKVADAVDNAVNGGAIEKALKFTNPVYEILLPLCIIYDGSMINSGSVIDTQTAQQQATYYDLAAKADQQKKGASDPKDAAALAVAVGATNSTLGDVGKSNALVRANGGSINSLGTTGSGAEANAMGAYNYDLLDVFASNISMPSSIKGPVLNYMKTQANATCSVMTNQAVAGAMGVANIVLALTGVGDITAAVEKGAAEGFTQGMLQFIKGMTARLGESFALKTAVDKTGATIIERTAMSRLSNLMWGATRFIGKQAAIIGGTIGLTEISKLVVFNYASQANSGLAQDTDLANIADSGGNIAANEAHRKILYGRPQTNTETALTDMSNLAYMREVDRSKSIYDRYISLDNSRSLLSRTAFSLSGTMNRNILGGIGKLSESLINPFRYMGSLFTSLNPLAHAASQTDAHYGNVQFGWTDDELNHISSDDSYSMMENQKLLEESGNEAAIAEKYSRCFTESLGTLFASGDIKRDQQGNVVNDPGAVCSPGNLTYTNSEFGSEMVFRWRVAKYKNAVLDQQLEVQAGPQNSSTSSSDSSAGLISPIKNYSGTVTNCWQKPGHAGVDLGTPVGTPVVAAAAGNVVESGPGGDAGNYIMIKTSDSQWINYQHLSRIDVSSGPVTQGQVIGLSGNTGYSTGPHLHFGVTNAQTLSSRNTGTNSVDPQPLLSGSGIKFACNN